MGVYQVQETYRVCFFFFVVKDPAADATDTPQS
jgi:hypothetical protein